MKETVESVNSLIAHGSDDTNDDNASNNVTV